MNGWTSELEQAYFDALAELAQNDDVRAIVVTGAGRAFCAVADMAVLDALGSGERTLSIAGGRRRSASIPKPIVAAVKGACAGVELVQALMCNVRIAAAGRS